MMNSKLRKDSSPQKATVVNNSQYSFGIPEDLYRAVRIKLIKENKKLRPMLIAMLEEYVKE